MECQNSSMSSMHLSTIPMLQEYDYITYGEEKAEALEKLSHIEETKAELEKTMGEAKEKERAGSLSFVVEGIHAYDICQFLDQYGIAARSGHHCAMPYLTALGCEYAVRFSVAPYNTLEEIRFAADACKKTCDMIRNVSAGKRR